MKIGLIAMSGVRAHNEELTRLGLTLPGFVDRNRIIASLPSLSLLTLAALTPPRFEVEYEEIFDLKKEKSFPLDYDLVAISSYTAQFYQAYDLADYYQSKNIPVVLGVCMSLLCPKRPKSTAPAWWSEKGSRSGRKSCLILKEAIFSLTIFSLLWEAMT